MVPRTSWDDWLDRDLTDGALVVAMAVSFSMPLLNVYRVSSEVNNAKSQGPGVIQGETF